MRTYADLLDHVARVVWGHGLNVSRDMIRTAVGTAYSGLPLLGNWRRYQSVYRLPVALRQTGTATLAGTTLTLSSGTWPSWAQYCSLFCRGTMCRVEERLSDTELQLTLLSGSISDGALSYTLSNDCHLLPEDFLNVQEVYLPAYGVQLAPTSFAEVTSRYGLISGVSLPDSYWVEHHGYRKYLRLFPPPSSAVDVDVHYRRNLKALRYTGRDARDTRGLIDVGTDKVTVTGTGTAFVSAMIGCALWVGVDTTPPTGPEGLSPYVESGIIKSVKNATELTLETTLQASYNDVAYAITDILDIDEHLYQVLVAQSTQNLSEMVGKPLAVDVNAVLRSALAADAAQLGSIPLSTRAAPRITGRMVVTQE